MITNIIATLDIVSVLALAACVILVLLPSARRALGKEVRLTIAAYFITGLFYQISIALEWTGITDSLDPYEDYIQLFQPFLLVFFLYSFIRGRAAKDKSEEEKRHQILFNASADAIFFLRIDQDGAVRCIDANQVAVRIFGYSRDEYMRDGLYERCNPEAASQRYAEISALCGGQRTAYEELFRTKEGRSVPVEVANQKYVHDGQDLIIAVVRDLTAQKRMESEIRQSQRMESVGRLAGGVAHDFNNILTVITGYSDLMLNTMSESNELREDVAEIRRAADRAVSLTKQLLAFSRKQVLEPRLISPGDIFGQSEQFLGRLIGEDIELEFVCNDDRARFLGDPSQIGQVVMNLAVNARDAMPNGGRLCFRCDALELPESFQVTRPEMPSGAYVLIECTDTGTGMSEEMINHIYEPFYTTKERGRGTGLGLSTAYGIVKQSDGFIYASSEPGHGTKFEIYFPVADSSEPSQESGVAPSEPVGGTETILLVEDESTVRHYASNILRKVGYNVVEAKDGMEALEKAAELGADLDLVISDVVMPRVNGPELRESLADLNPDVRIVFITGYAGDNMIAGQLPEGYELLLEKPFGSADLLEMIGRALRDES